MHLYNLTALLPIALLLMSCNRVPSTSPAQTYALAQTAWQQPWHGTWELTWQESPIAGPILFEGWQTASGRQRRYEILEANVPSLIGLVYINDGTFAQYYNRLESTVPLTQGSATLPFSPIRDAFDQVSQRLLNESVQSIEQRVIAVTQGTAIELILRFTPDTRLTLWLDVTRHLILKADLTSPAVHLALIARGLEPLPDPHPRLFRIKQ